MYGIEDFKKYIRECPPTLLDLTDLTYESFKMQSSNCADYSAFVVSIEMEEKILGLTWVEDFEIIYISDKEQIYNFVIEMEKLYPDYDFYICISSVNNYSTIYSIFKKQKVLNNFKKVVLVCHLCYFYDLTNCRRYPPQLLVIYENDSYKIISRFAKVNSNTPACGEFELKTTNQIFKERK